MWIYDTVQICVMCLVGLYFLLGYISCRVSGDKAWNRENTAAALGDGTHRQADKGNTMTRLVLIFISSSDLLRRDFVKWYLNKHIFLMPQPYGWILKGALLTVQAILHCLSLLYSYKQKRWFLSTVREVPLSNLVSSVNFLIFLTSYIRNLFTK